MERNKRTARFFGVLLFSIGILMAVLLAGLAAWADVEAVFYGFPFFGGEKLKGLSCPVLLSSSETGVLSARLKNTTDRAIDMVARAEVSTPLQTRAANTKLSLEPGEAATATWPVTKDDVDLRFFIMAKVSTYPTYRQPFREATCGIFVLDLPFRGEWAAGLLLGGSLVLILAGLWLWHANSRRMEGSWLLTSYALRFLGALVLAALLVSLRGLWLAAILLLAVTVLLVFATLAYALSR